VSDESLLASDGLKPGRAGVPWCCYK